MKTFLTFIGTVAVVALFSCGSKQIPKDFDYGKVEKGRYTNTYFNMRMDIPDSWYVQTSAENDSLMREGLEMSQKNSKKVKQELDALKVTTANLLTIFHHQPGTHLEENNPSLIMMAENLGNNLLITNGKDYLKAARNQLKSQTAVKYFFPTETYTKVTLGGKTFYLMPTRLENMGVTVYQNYYATVTQGFGISIIQSYVEPAEKTALDKTLNSLFFKD